MRDENGVCPADNEAEHGISARQVARYPQAPGPPGDVAGSAGSQKGGSVVDYAERLRRLVINDACFAGTGTGRTDVEPRNLDPKTLALVRLAALVAVGGAVPSYGAHADAAVDAGATAAEIVDVLVGVIPVVGLPAVVATAPKLALALGYDTDEALEP
jgi:alkylhydroperoxidase/carboxymuconolactone decarboxylase family protein YurZ